MSESSNRRAKGPPDPAQIPPTERPTPEPSVWDNADVEHDPPSTIDALLPPVSTPVPANRTPGGDSQPTIISSKMVRTGEDVVGSLRGKRLAHFELIAPIGVGGMAAVIKGRDLQLDRTVALKILPPEMAVDPENVRRFHHEARAAAKLDHENIARVFYCGEDQRLHFIAFEFVQGENLRTILERRGRLPVGEAVHYILQVATGLAHASGRGVVHRDIKPSNIIITPTGRAKLVDMGLARSLSTQDDKQLTQSGVTLGTFDYISPEQALEPREADVRSDIYSLGCTFYHMLTGQPPVPEGTAARKLHFHENELAIDPRQLNPEVPDEVAAIIGRMMAKNPRDRFQKPEHLVEHLLRVAQKLESGREQADGLLYVDAPLPTRSTRPLFLVALAVAAVVALIFALEQPGTPKPSIQHRPFVKGPPNQGEQPPKNTDKKEPEKPDNGQGSVTVNKPHFNLHSNTKLEDLQEWARTNSKPEADLEIVVHDNFELKDDKALNQTLVDLRGQSITIRAALQQSRPTIWLTYSDSGKAGTGLITGLRLRAEKTVVLRGLRFIGSAAATAMRTLVHVESNGKGNYLFDDCHFIHKQPKYSSDLPFTSVFFENKGSGGLPELNLNQCVFLGDEDIPQQEPPKTEDLQRVGKGGQYAVVRKGQGKIVAEHCVFGPHQCCFRLEGDNQRQQKADLNLDHCSAMLALGSAVFHIEGQAISNIAVSHSVFSRPESRKDEAIRRGGLETDLSATTGAFLIRDNTSGGPRPGSFLYRGTDNRYHNLDGYIATLPDLITEWSQFLAFQNEQRGSESPKSLLPPANSPWSASNPLDALKEVNRIQEAFRVKSDVKELRVAAASDSHLIGAEKCNRVEYNLDLKRLSGEQPPETAKNIKYVDPTLKQYEPGVYENLDGALSAAKPGDEILIKHNGKLLLTQITLHKLGLDVTIKPAPNFRPLLVLSTEDKEAAMFELRRGKLKLQDLDFLLAPSQMEFELQSVVKVVGDAEIKFDRCTITLGDPQGCQLVAVSLCNPDTQPLKPTKMGEIIPSGPSINFERSFIRGKGDLVWCRGSRPFKFRAAQTLVAIGGSLLTMDGSKFAENLPPPGVGDSGPRCAITLEEMTAVTASHLFHLNAHGSPKKLVPIKFEANKCVLTPSGGKAFLSVSELEDQLMGKDEGAFRNLFSWGPSGSNVYGKWLTYAEQKLKGKDMGMMKMTRPETWVEITEETNSKFPDTIKFEGDIDSPTVQLLPSKFRIKDMIDVGANIDGIPDPNRGEK